MDHRQAADRIMSQVMKTGDLFPEDLAIARKSDPVTSKLAAVRYSANRRNSDKEMMRRLIKRYPGHTAAELSAILLTKGVNWYRAARMTTKRISDIRHELEVGELRRCKITDEYAKTYSLRTECEVAA